MAETPPPLNLRRVVTGHDAQGRAIVAIDEMAQPTAGITGATFSVVWSTQGFPVDNGGNEDTSVCHVGISEDNGTVLRVVSFPPRVKPRVHRTDSIDYGIVISGEIDLELDDGVRVHLKAGDVVVQRGTIHNWANHGRTPCVMAFALIAAKPVTAGGRTLAATA